MKLYDGIIKTTEEILADAEAVVTEYDSKKCWKDAGENQLLLRRDAAFELGGSGKPSVNYTCVTSSGMVTGDTVEVYGDDLQDMTEDGAFARIVILEVGDIGQDEEAYQAIRNMEYVRYHIFPKGYMIRVSSTSNEEQVRVSRRVVDAGIRFSYIGNAYIRAYKKIPGVKHVRVIFVTNVPKVQALLPYATKVDDITQTLTHILDGLPTDCGHCSMKTVCDEVDGMREEHMKRARKQMGAAE